MARRAAWNTASPALNRVPTMDHDLRNCQALRRLAIRLLLVCASFSPEIPRVAHAEPPTHTLPPPASQTIEFTRDIAPILTKNCYRCHGSKKQQGGLDLHVPERALAGGDSGAAIVPGKSAESRLIRYVARLDAENMMPPEDAGDPLSAAQVGLLRAWIDQGSLWSDAAGPRGCQ